MATARATSLFILLLVFIDPLSVFAAQKTMTRYLMDANVQAVATQTSSWKSDTTNYVIFASSGTINVWSGATVTGNVYAKTVKAQSGVTINGNVIAESVTLDNGATVNGSVCASNGDVTLNSYGATVRDDINAWGNITIGSGGTAKSSVYATKAVTLQASNASVSSAVNAGGNVGVDYGCSVNGNICLCSGCTLTNHGSIKSTVSPPCTSPVKCPAITAPKLQTYTAGGSDVNVSSSEAKTLTPGKYGTVTFAYGGILTLKAGTCASVGDSGCYYFTKFTGGTDSSETLRLDFSTGSQITVFSVGDIKWSGPIQVSTNGTTWTDVGSLYSSNRTSAETLAKKVYWETHGVFTMTSNGSTRQWFGTVLASSDMTIIDSAYVVGSLASASGSMTSNTTSITLNYILADFARNNW